MLNFIFKPFPNTATIADVEQFISHYRIPPITEIKILAQGVQSMNYLVRTQKQSYLVKILRTQSSRQKLVVDLLQYLANRNHPVPLPIFQKDGTLLDHTHFPGACALFSYLEGEPCDEYNALQVASAAEELAKLHLSMLEFKAEKKLKSFYPFPHLLKQAIFEHVKKEAPDFKEKVKETQLILNRLLMNPLTYGLCHNDLRGDHLLFSKDRLIGILDFFTLFELPLLFDISFLFLEIAFDPKGRPNYEFINLAIDAYRKHFPLKDEEWSLLPEFLKVASLYRYLISIAKHESTIVKERFKSAYHYTTTIGVAR